MIFVDIGAEVWYIGVNYTYPEEIMELGEKIKAARLEAGLSQRQLCGDMITRNMLSLIESGRARPSMDTLTFLAAQLGKPIGFFLESEAVTSPNQAVMDTANAAYAAQAYRSCLEALEAYKVPDSIFDDARYLLGALAAMKLAEHAIAEGKLPYAGALLDKAKLWGEESVYWCDALKRQQILLSFMADPTRAEALVSQLPEDNRELVLRARAALEAQDAGGCARILDAAEAKDAPWYLLRGLASLELGEFAGAAACLREAEQAYPQQCVPALERCYRELGDFQRAYEYACKQKN